MGCGNSKAASSPSTSSAPIGTGAEELQPGENEQHAHGTRLKLVAARGGGGNAGKVRVGGSGTGGDSATPSPEHPAADADDLDGLNIAALHAVLSPGTLRNACGANSKCVAAWPNVWLGVVVQRGVSCDDSEVVARRTHRY